MNLQFENKINEITKIIDSNSVNKIGLLDGESGLILFYYNLSLYQKTDAYNDKIINLIDCAINQINTSDHVPSFCSGTSGFFWLLNHLVKNKFLDKSEISFLNEIDDYLYQVTVNDFTNNKIDFLHGIIGTGLYFLSRVGNNPKVEYYIDEIINYLDRKKTYEKDTITWITKILQKKDKEGYEFADGIDFGLSHGIASILSFLGKAYIKGISVKKTEYLAKGLFNYILLNRDISKSKLSTFPQTITSKKTNKVNQLAWCYGDLGLSTAMLNTAKIFGFNEFEEISKDTLVFCSKKRNNIDIFVDNPAICHGIAGIAHIFKRIWLNTKNEVFLVASNHWYKELMKLSNHKDGLAGFKNFHLKGQERIWFNSTNILEGISGIGLSLINYLSDIEPTWDECLLLS